MPTTSKDFATILAERQEYLDTLKQNGDLYTRIFLEDTFLYQMGDSGLAPLTTAQHSTMKKWKEATQ
tara:strand:- start:311 stop:511 length:201 start_codon:yes stop_codon:yes gene_type:complete